jgi:hypothetical protein
MQVSHLPAAQRHLQQGGRGRVASTAAQRQRGEAPAATSLPHSPGAPSRRESHDCSNMAPHTPRASVARRPCRARAAVPCSCSGQPRVVATREHGKNGKLMSALERHGISCLELPLIEHAPGPDRRAGAEARSRVLAAGAASAREPVDRQRRRAAGA